MSNKFWFGWTLFWTGSVFPGLLAAETTNGAIYLSIIFAMDIIACMYFSNHLDKELK